MRGKGLSGHLTVPFLRIPPFPHHRARPLSAPTSGPGDGATFHDHEALVASLQRERVGGCFWAKQPPLLDGRDLVLAPANQSELDLVLAKLGASDLTRAIVLVPEQVKLVSQLPMIAQPCDPWWIGQQAKEWLGNPGTETAVVAALCGCRIRSIDDSAWNSEDHLRARLQSWVIAFQYNDPFSGEPITPLQAISLLGEWRRLIDANRTLAGIYGVAHWKRITADAMLWAGSTPLPYDRTKEAWNGKVQHNLAWKSRVKPAKLAALGKTGVPLGEIEDGFIRSVGLGANCVPPLSLIVDFAGIYFDPSGPSDLEAILEGAEISPELCARAAELRHQLVAGAISKYGQGGSAIARPEHGLRRVLVTGQVEDDRSILSGGGGTSNLELLKRARAMEPDAWLIYKPHPDVEAGHRKGHVTLHDALRFADEVHSEAPIIPLIDSVDSLHVITSLSGFEALLRGKPVTTHGVPFYAGWGLTRDLGPVPARRTRQRTLDELVAATLLLYPRYLDPVTRLPCPAEVVVARMAAGQATVSSPLVKLREWQGRLNQWVRRIGRGTR